MHMLYKIFSLPSCQADPPFSFSLIQSSTPVAGSERTGFKNTKSRSVPRHLEQQIVVMRNPAKRGTELLKQISICYLTLTSLNRAKNSLDVLQNAASFELRHYAFTLHPAGPFSSLNERRRPLRSRMPRICDLEHLRPATFALL